MRSAGIGFPGEEPESMAATLRQAARVKHRCPGSGSEVYPFRAIPGTEDYEHALALGWTAPGTFHEWGKCFEWKWHADHTPLPAAIHETWRRCTQTAAHYDRHVREGPRVLRDALAKIAGWRLRRNEYSLPVEQKLFDGYVRLSGQGTPGSG